MEKRSNIKVLSIGIDHYAHESIPNLGGAVADAEKLRQFFIESLGVPVKNYISLYNEAATRSAIVTNFREHFGCLEAGDVAVFHFSGHGSWEPCSPAFVDANLDPAGGRNEVLVCNDSRVNGSLPLADKELRLLLAEAQVNSSGEQIEALQFICLLDCCHSGSMFRLHNRDTRNRLCRASGQERPLEQYLEGQYQQMNTLHIPPANFMLLAACGPSESALEDDNGGFFTNALLSQLKAAHALDSYPSYAELFPTLRERIFQRSRSSQTPHIEAVGKVNPFDTFLGLPGKTQITYPSLVRHSDKWKVNLGAIHGVVFDEVCQQEIPIFHTADIQQIIGWCKVASVELEYTLIGNFRLEQKNASTKEEIDQVLGASQQEIRVGLSGRPLPLRIDRQTDKPEAVAIYKYLQQSSFLLVHDTARYQLLLNDNQLELQGPNKQKLLTITRYQAMTASYLSHLLFQIGKWETVSRLTNSKSSLISPEKITLSFEYRDSNGILQCFDRHHPDQDHQTVVVEYDPDKGPVLYNIKFSHTNSRRLYCYLLHLDRKYGIKQKHENYTKYLLLGEDIYLYQSITDRIGLGISDDQTTEVEDNFVLIAGLQPLSVPYAFNQTGLEKHFQKTIDPTELQPTQTEQTREDLALPSWNETEWISRKITVRTIRKRSRE